jgi:hypothetical protein
MIDGADDAVDLAHACVISRKFTIHHEAHEGHEGFGSLLLNFVSFVVDVIPFD